MYVLETVLRILPVSPYLYHSLLFEAANAANYLNFYATCTILRFRLFLDFNRHPIIHSIHEEREKMPRLDTVPTGSHLAA